MSFMGPKAIAVTLVLIVSAVAAYDVKYLLDRKKNAAATPAAAGSTDANAGSRQLQLPDAQAAQPRPRPVDADGAAGAAQQADAAGKAPAAQLPPVFRMDWVNPFTKEPEATSAAGAPPDTGAAPHGVDVLAAYNPIISAVLIGSTMKRVVINRQVYSEGDCIPAIGAMVKAVTPAGVELTVGANSRFFPLSPPQAKGSLDNQ